MFSFRDIVFSLVIVSAVITGTLSFHGAVISQCSADDIETGPLTRMTTLSDQMYSSVQSNLTETVEKVGSENIVESLWYTGKSVFTGLTIMLMAIPTFTGITAEVLSYGFMPPWFAALVTAIVTIIIFLLLISLRLVW